MCNNGLVVGMVKDMRRLEVVTGIGMDRCGKHLRGGAAVFFTQSSTSLTF